MSDRLIRNGSRTEEITTILTEEILNGPLLPGERLGEKELATRFGTSRGPIREALRKLEMRGLIRLTPNVGARVAYYTLSDYIQLFMARECMEGMAARLAATSMTDREKKALHNLLKAHEEQFQSHPDGIYAQPQANIDFHYAIIRGSKNPLLFNILCGELYPLFQLCRRLHRHIPGRGKRALAEHAHVLEAIEERDGDWAEMTMRRHLSAARSCVESIFRAEDPSPKDHKLLDFRPSIFKWENAGR